MSRSPHARHTRAPKTEPGSNSKPPEITSGRPSPHQHNNNNSNRTPKDNRAAITGSERGLHSDETARRNFATERHRTGSDSSDSKKTNCRKGQKTNGSRVHSQDDIGATRRRTAAVNKDTARTTRSESEHESRDLGVGKGECHVSDTGSGSKVGEKHERNKTKSIAEKARRLSRAKHSCRTSDDIKETEKDKHDTYEPINDPLSDALKRDSTYVKPEPSILTDKHPENKQENGKSGITDPAADDVDDNSVADSDSGTPFQVLEYVYSPQKSKTMDSKTEPGAESEQTIEDVASNFMKRMERLEEENVNLLSDNKRLLEKLKTAEEGEEKLVNEIHVLKGEYAELTIDYHNVKDENLALLKRLGDANREKESLKKALQEESATLTEEIKILEEEKAKLRQTLDDLELVVEELNVKSNSDELALKSLQEEVEQLREEKIELESSNELDHLREDFEEKERLVGELEKKLEDLHKLKSDSTKMESELRSLRQQLKTKNATLAEKDDYITSLDKEKALLCDKLAKLRAGFKENSTEIEELLKKNESLLSSKKSLQKTINDLRSENKTLKEKQQATALQDDEMEMIKAEIKEVKSKIEIMKTTERAMSDLLLSKQNHIADLRNENAELRNVGKLHQHEVDELRAERKEKAVISDKYGDIAESHKRLLAENRRFRSMMANKAMQETNAATERSELEGEIEDLERKLRKAQKRILQLENWMDDIYSGKEYAMIPRNDGLRGSVLSLPEIPLLDTSRSNKLTARMTSRREAPVERITARTLAELPR